ncbi:hypothetical protein PTKU64_90130 (plasmid) [Paraburkholderia terrae]|uniref:O-antigen ligase domain-containing protein n=1 Tax=Paraburkholderia terrae TaxID=311230 RepID=A0ABM7U2X7_9BURK|nr:hypothetical protein [Paraburkholderia terrae]BCZ85338.1 hypothetical protein PTKU64_90130 [Paraburkholderia terrae]
MKSTQTLVSATGEQVYLLDRILFYLWLMVPAYQYSDLHVQNSRVGFWGIAALLIFRIAMRDLLRRRFVLASRGLLIPFTLVFAWKFVELVREPGSLDTAVLFFVDFLVTYTCCLLVAPRIFTVRAWLVGFRRVNLFALGLAIVAHPFIPDRTDMAGWDKGESWAFAHPNVAAMYPLTICLITMIMFGMRMKGRVRWFDIFCVAFSVVTLVLTNSRTTLAILVVATLLSLFNVIALTYVRDKPGRDVQALGIALKLCAAIVILGGAYIAFLSLGAQDIDDKFSGRLSFAVQVILSAKDLVLGVGLLPPGSNLLADNSTRGAGIDGLYTNLVYGEGYVGLVIFAIAMYGFHRMASFDRRCRVFFDVALVSGLLFGVTETHFWLLASPLTALVAVLASTLGTQAGSRTIVNLGAPLPKVIQRKNSRA